MTVRVGGLDLSCVVRLRYNICLAVGYVFYIVVLVSPINCCCFALLHIVVTFFTFSYSGVFCCP